MMLEWHDDNDKTNAEADAFGKRWGELIRKAQTPNPQEMAERVRQELECVRQEQEWAKLVETRVQTLIYDLFGHRALCVAEPTDIQNCGTRARDWA